MTWSARTSQTMPWFCRKRRKDRTEITSHVNKAKTFNQIPFFLLIGESPVSELSTDLISRLTEGYPRILAWGSSLFLFCWQPDTNSFKILWYYQNSRRCTEYEKLLLATILYPTSKSQNPNRQPRQYHCRRCTPYSFSVSISMSMMVSMLLSIPSSPVLSEEWLRIRFLTSSGISWPSCSMNRRM